VFFGVSMSLDDFIAPESLSQLMGRTHRDSHNDPTFAQFSVPFRADRSAPIPLGALLIDAWSRAAP
jgi:hypothetical protein